MEPWLALLSWSSALWLPAVPRTVDDGPPDAKTAPVPLVLAYSSVVGTCQSCGRDGEHVVAVQRVYLVVDLPGSAEPGTPPGEEVHVVDEVEYWCATCEETFPHVLVARSVESD